jgi:site-specific recombinase XerD
MTPLRQRLVDDLELRNYSPRTIECYVAHVVRFAGFCGQSPDVLGADAIRAYQRHLLDKKASWSQFNQAVCALRFFYGTTLARTDLVPMLPFGKRPKTLACVLSPEEVAQLLEATCPGRERMLVKTAYACGLRLMEGLNLEVGDIDSGRMVVHVRQGKGNKDRLVPLSLQLLTELREYWRVHRPQRWLFYAQSNGVQRPLHPGTVQRQLRRAVKKAGLRKAATMHTLRHSFATHMLEAGVDVMTLQKILGHSQLSTTARYLHLRGDYFQRLPSLLDRLALPVANLPEATVPAAKPFVAPSAVAPQPAPSAVAPPAVVPCAGMEYGVFVVSALTSTQPATPAQPSANRARPKGRGAEGRS